MRCVANAQLLNGRVSMRTGLKPGTSRRVGQTVKPRAASVLADTGAESFSDIVHWQGDKRLQTQVLPLALNTTSIRSLDWDRDRFDIEFGLDKGTTYNSYLIFGDKVALVDASHEKFSDLYMNTLEQQLKAAGRDKIDYIFVSHTEPDHSGLIPKVLDKHPDAIVCGSKVCLMFLQGLTHRPFNSQMVKGGDKIDLGQGHEIEFVMAPNLHWPDTMFSFDHGTGIMYTCDAFGLHFCDEDAFDVDLKKISAHYRFYYDCLMRPNAKSVTTALRKIKDLPLTAIANGHGPILRYNVEELMGMYRDWSADMSKAGTSVAIFYASEYGFSDRLSQTLARGITKAGVQTEMIDLLSADAQDIVAVAGRSKGLVVMSPPCGNPQAQTAMAALTSAVKPGTKVIVAESFGGNDEAVDLVKASFIATKAEVLGAALRVKEMPNQALYQQFEEAGTDMAQVLTCKDAIARKKQAMSPDVAKSLARISSGLYLITASHNNARSAMIASWVSQASFEPLGFTVSVAKDRAIESLMQVGDSFVINVLGEDSYNGVMKHFLKRFSPGADRFEGVDWFPAKNSCPVLKDAISYMECKVVSRMESPDHWITYCEVMDGAVLRPQVRTAVHTRKVANYY